MNLIEQAILELNYDKLEQILPCEYEPNLLEFIDEKLQTYGGKDTIKPLSGINYITLLGSDPFMDKEEAKIKTEKFYRIFELICKNYPHMINDKYYSNHKDILSNILDKYYVEKDSCYICLSNHKFRLINSLCKCKNKVHFQCLLNLIKSNIKQEKCSVCLGNLGFFIDKRRRIMFPHLDIYPQPLISNYLFLKEENYTTKLHYAIAYFQTPRVFNLLRKMSDEDIKDYYIKADRYALHNACDMTIKDMPYTNLPKAEHETEAMIIEIFLKERIDKVNVSIETDIKEEEFDLLLL